MPNLPPRSTLAEAEVSSMVHNRSSAGNPSRGLDAFKELWDKALAKHQSQLGIDIIESASARKIRDAATAEELMAVVDCQVDSFDRFRNSGRRVTNALKQVVQCIASFSDSIGDAASVRLVFDSFG